MKKLLIIGLLVTFGISFGQEKEENSNVQKGTWNLGGNFTLNNSSSEINNNSSNTENNQFYVGFYPRVGYAINNNLIIGIGIGYEYHNNKNYYSETESYNSDQNGIVVFPYIKKYFNVNEKFSFHLQGEFRVSKSWNDNNSSINFNSYEENNSSLFVGIRPGITFFLTEKIVLETSIGALGYSTGKNESNNREGKFNSFNFNFNSNNLLLGLSYFF
ncbi:outer membrane beta-barrel protein [Lutibacter flavus]|uniref:Outer membrane protein beta-barrel domain-containing protein n=1 Tax=Lutibacter flavus TaxID=691689 RepID=A0A238W1G6_9FLAO|nr:outer membrane beta-barrel protein [Lutibacter flavus]SNR39549.1 Outer membrane protein beta-barrel domain-containing protein [Lutibacter flavus]